MVDKPWDYKRTFRRSRILFWPSVFATGVFLLWREIYVRFGQRFSLDEQQLLIGVIGFIGVFHGIIAAMTITKADTDRKDMHKALRCGDLVQFVDLRDARIFWPIHWMLGSFSFLIILGTYLIRYSTMIAGGYTVSAISFLLAMYWRAATVTDNPLKSAWYREDDVQIPEEFRTMTRTEAENRMAEEKTRREMFDRFRVRPYEADSPQFRHAAERFGKLPS